MDLKRFRDIGDGANKGTGARDIYRDLAIGIRIGIGVNKLLRHVDSKREKTKRNLYVN